MAVSKEDKQILKEKVFNLMLDIFEMDMSFHYAETRNDPLYKALEQYLMAEGIMDDDGSLMYEGDVEYWDQQCEVRGLD